MILVMIIIVEGRFNLRLKAQVSDSCDDYYC